MDAYELGGARSASTSFVRCRTDSETISFKSAHFITRNSLPSSEPCAGKSRVGLFYMFGFVEGPWTGRQTSASGQTFEFRVWAAITEQSRGRLRVLLPTADRGVEGMVARVRAESDVPAQVEA